MMRAPAVEIPAKMVIERRIRHGFEREFRAWAERLVSLAAANPAHQGASVLNAADGHTFLLLRFRSKHDLEEWSGSTVVLALLRAGDAFSLAVEHAVVRSGFETWFTLPGHAAAAPPRWKMALVTWCALLPQVLVLGLVVPTSVPSVARAVMTTAIPVVMLTWVIMPRLTALLHRWLYPGPAMPLP